MRMTSVRLMRRARSSERRLEQDERRFPTSLACASCHYLQLCGGLARASGGLSCLEDCCGGKLDCNRVCPARDREFYEALEETGGFAFDTAVESVVPVPQISSVAFLIKNGSSRGERLKLPAAAVPLFDVIDSTAARLRYADRMALAAAMRLDDTVPLILSGVDEDQPLEDWWQLSPHQQRHLLDELLRLIQPELVTTPNYSLFTTVPRFNDLHSMKRIEIVWRDMVRAGLPTALHVNSRTARDYERWTELVLSQPGIVFIAIEWSTIRRSNRVKFHVEHLLRMARAVRETGRQLGLVARGTSGMAALASSFSPYIVIDSDPFMKAVKRQAIDGSRESHRLQSTAHPTAHGSTIDELLRGNVYARRAELTRRIEEARRSATKPENL